MALVAAIIALLFLTHSIGHTRKISSDWHVARSVVLKLFHVKISVKSYE